jgi:pectate lyase-like protein
MRGEDIAGGDEMKKLPLFLVLASSLSLLDSCGGGGGTTTTTPPPLATHFSVSGPANIPLAISFNFTVTALDASNNTVTNYPGTVHFTSTDPHAQLPADSTLAFGTNVFPATLTTAGNQVITATDKATSSITGSSNSINIGALPDAFPVEWFGARGDGVTDDTGAIQNAINAAASAGGGSVVFKVARYFTTGSFVVPTGVVLSGAVEGPFDVAGVNPATTAIAPTLLVTNTSTPFITLNGLGTGVTDLLFHYPNQVKTSASTPTVYPYTIVLNAPAGKVVRSTVTNAYNFLNMELGRKMAQDLYIGAFNIGINIDNDEDFTTLHNIHNGVFWDEVENVSYPTLIDSWVLNHGTALVVGRMDSLEVHDFFAFSRFAGILLTDSQDTSLNPLCGWGSGSNVDLETVQYGIIAISATGQAYKFTNLQVGAAPGAQAAVQLRAGGSCPPDILIDGGSVRGTWALGAFPTPQAGRLTHVNVIGSDLP